jgi:hypothetical protein
MLARLTEGHLLETARYAPPVHHRGGPRRQAPAAAAGSGGSGGSAALSSVPAGAAGEWGGSSSGAERRGSAGGQEHQEALALDPTRADLAPIPHIMSVADLLSAPPMVQAELLTRFVRAGTDGSDPSALASPEPGAVLLKYRQVQLALRCLRRDMRRGVHHGSGKWFMQLSGERQLARSGDLLYVADEKKNQQSRRS